MNLSDLNALSGLQLAFPAAATATTTGPAVDLQSYIGVLRVSQTVGTVAGTSPTLDGKIQDSADGVTFADVAGLTFPTVTAANSAQSIQVDTRAVRRYIRHVATVGGSAGQSFTYHAGALGQKRYM